MNTDLKPSWNPRTLAHRESIAKFFRVGVTRVDWIPCEGARGERVWELGLLPEEDVKGWFFVDLDRMTCEICKDQLQPSCYIILLTLFSVPILVLVLLF